MASLTAIAEGILADARRLDQYTASKGISASTFENDSLSNLPEDLEERRKSLVDSTQRLKQLAHGPVGLLLEVLFFVSAILVPLTSEAVLEVAPQRKSG